ncbi:MAG: heparan-alpha-glucosaminide N-acetyltransferase domain-containing protein [Promethearchaeota archaeon]|jgi:uncharacterized membrane protein
MSNLNETYINDNEEVQSSKRIASIDFVKGLALGFIIWAHAALSWLDKEWRYIYGLLFAFLDILGPSLFVFLSALSVVFSIKRKKKGLSEKAIRNNVFTRGTVIIIIGVLMNPMSLQTAGESVAFPASLWGWNILMFIGFSQIFSYFALKFSKATRAIGGSIVIFISPWIRQLLYSFKDSNFGVNILHFIITSPLPQVPFLPWIAVCFISTIFGEYLFEAMTKGTIEAYYELFRKFLIYGVILIILGFFIIVPGGLNMFDFNQWEPGWALQNVVIEDIDGNFIDTVGTVVKSEYLHIDLLRLANRNVIDYIFPGMPLFMIRSTAQNMFYNLGAALLIIAVSFYYIDIRKKQNNVIKLVIFYGKVSLSLFLIQYIFLPLYLGQFPITQAPFVFVGYSGFLGLLMYIWLKYYNGVGSPEWMMKNIGNIGRKKKKI